MRQHFLSLVLCFVTLLTAYLPYWSFLLQALKLLKGDKTFNFAGGWWVDDLRRLSGLLRDFGSIDFYCKLNSEVILFFLRVWASNSSLKGEKGFIG